MNIKTNLSENARLTFLQASTLLLVFAFCASVLPEKTFAAVVKVSAIAVQTETGDENFDKKFREGRDFIDKQEWAKAAAKFNEAINQYPDNKSVDAALYWLAFCYKKQREFEKLGATVDRLLKNHPSSSWTGDARVLLIEVAQPVKIIYGTVGQDKTTSIADVYTTYAQSKPIQPLARTSATQVADTYAVLNGLYAANLKTPLDREDEIRIAAFQSLLSADYTKALQAMNEILKTDSKNSESLKIEVLRSLRRPRFIETLTPAERAAGNTAPSIKSRFAAAFKEPLFKVFQNEPNTKIRTEIIYTLASLKDEQTTSYLNQLYDSENDKEIKKTIINGLGSFWGDMNTYFAFLPAPVKGSTTIISNQKMTLTTANSEPEKRPEFNKLLDIFKTEKDSELRRLAFNNLRRFRGWENSRSMVEVLSQTYDAETDELLKRSIIQSLAEIRQPQASKKLLEIAKNDKSNKLRIEAIRLLGQSKDPEALKYLEEIIK